MKEEAGKAVEKAHVAKKIAAVKGTPKAEVRAAHAVAKAKQMVKEIAKEEEVVKKDELEAKQEAKLLWKKKSL